MDIVAPKSPLHASALTLTAACVVGCASAPVDVGHVRDATMSRPFEASPTTPTTELEDTNRAQFERAVERVVRRSATRDDFRRLREAIAAEPGEPDSDTENRGAEQKVIAALVLVDYFADLEAFADAIAVVDAAIASSAEPSVPIELRRARIRLLLDVDRVTEARAAAVAATAAAPGDPAVWLLLAQCAYREEDLAASRAALAVLTGSGALRESEWVEQHRSRVLELSESIRVAERNGGKRPIDSNELLAKLRGTAAEDHAFRRRGLNALLTNAETRERGMTVGLLHSDPIIRVQALRAMLPDDPNAQRIVIAALADQDPRVRGSAASAATRLEVDPEFLLRRLEVEETAYPFRCLHQALRALVGPGIDLPPGAEESAESRSDVRNAWRRNWNR